MTLLWCLYAFSWYFILELRKVLSAGTSICLLVIKVQTNKNYEALMQIIPYLPNDSNYNMKRNLYWIYKVKWLSALSKHLWSLLRLSFCKNNFFTGKKASGKYFSGHHWYFKCTKAESCTDIKFKATLYCLSVTVEDINL